MEHYQTLRDLFIVYNHLKMYLITDVYNKNNTIIFQHASEHVFRDFGSNIRIVNNQGSD